MFRSDFRCKVWVGVFIFWIVEIVDDVKMKSNENIYCYVIDILHDNMFNYTLKLGK